MRFRHWCTLSEVEWEVFINTPLSVLCAMPSPPPMYSSELVVHKTCLSSDLRTCRTYSEGGWCEKVVSSFAVEGGKVKNCNWEQWGVTWSLSSPCRESVEGQSIGWCNTARSSEVSLVYLVMVSLFYTCILFPEATHALASTSCIKVSNGKLISYLDGRNFANRQVMDKVLKLNRLGEEWEFTGVLLHLR